MQHLYHRNQPTLSFEIFPSNNTHPIHRTYEVLDQLATLQPDYMSVTYGAGGTGATDSIKVSSYIQNKLQIPTLSHLTCIHYNKSELLAICAQLKESNITNVLALRGDRPQNMSDLEYHNRTFHHATEMVSSIAQLGGFTIAGAAYPEKHFEAVSLASDLVHLKEKVDAGLSFLITQLFFDNDHFYRFREELDNYKITIPISCGIMPITSVNQLRNTISLSGSSVPKRLSDLIAKYGDYPEEMRKAGSEYAITQINDLLAHKVDGIHLYTMNRPKTTADIVANISL